MFGEVGKIEVEVGQCEARILLALIFNFFDNSGTERLSQPRPLLISVSHSQPTIKPISRNQLFIIVSNLRYFDS